MKNQWKWVLANRLKVLPSYLEWLKWVSTLLTVPFLMLLIAVIVDALKKQSLGWRDLNSTSFTCRRPLLHPWHCVIFQTSQSTDPGIVPDLIDVIFKPRIKKKEKQDSRTGNHWGPSHPSLAMPSVSCLQVWMCFQVELSEQESKCIGFGLSGQLAAFSALQKFT